MRARRFTQKGQKSPLGERSAPALPHYRGGVLNAVVSALEGWQGPDPAQERLRRDYLDHLRRHGDAGLWKSGVPQHVTASCVVLSEDLDEALLCLHGKGRFWVQFGGHLERDDASLADAARREAREESGVDGLELLAPTPFDLDRHALSGAWRCAEHLDVGFVSVLPRSTAAARSAESDDVAWWPLEDLPAPLAAGLADRLARAQRFALSTR